MGHVWLIGMMGSGKTTVGAILAERMGRPLIDTDVAVMEETGRTIPELFDESEALFRSAEVRAIERASESDPAVIATGGGAVLDEVNLTVMRRTGTVVLLETTSDELERRLNGANGADDRPLIATAADIDRILSSRHHRYLEAGEHVVHTTGRDPAAVAEEVAACIGM
ncbi:MAG TPA: shikimate kinase [Acidimicrobiia bacterium]|nr:shikimate kinase [Acidimicrobiia bacterium]